MQKHLRKKICEGIFLTRFVFLGIYATLIERIHYKFLDELASKWKLVPLRGEVYVENQVVCPLHEEEHVFDPFL